MGLGLEGRVGVSWIGGGSILRWAGSRQSRHGYALYCPHRATQTFVSYPLYTICTIHKARNSPEIERQV